MNGFKTLESLVKELETTQEQREIEEKLQEINATLLQFYTIQVGAIHIKPLLVEAYYCCDKFPDTTSHKDTLQKARFGKLYCHYNSPNPNRNGLDVVLSCGDYYLSILLKATLCNLNGTQTFAKQSDIYEIFKSLHKDAKLIAYLESLENVLKPQTETKSAEVKHITRINLNEKDNEQRFAHKLLGSYLVEYKEEIAKLGNNYAKAVKEP